MHEVSHQLRCVGCGAVILPDTVEKDFRCVDCGELLEVEYPSWSEAGAPFRQPTPYAQSGRPALAMAGEAPIQATHRSERGVALS